MDISILISTKNNAGRLKDTLHAISRCSFRPNLCWEVVVVNHDSRDQTEKTVMELQGLLPLKYAVETRPGLGAARNCCLSISTGKVLIITDDDVKPGPAWVETYWAAYVAHPAGRFWGGPIESEFEDGEPDWDLVRLGPPSIKGLELGESERSLLHDGPVLVGANWACPRDALLQTGGFNPQFGLNTAFGSGEETELMQRLMSAGMEAWYLPAARLRHIVPKSKISLKHIGGRRRAYGRWTSRNSTEVWKRRVPVIGVPPWILRKVVEAMTNWMVARMSGKKAFDEYLYMQEMLGVADGMRIAYSGSGTVVRSNQHV